MTSSRLNLGDFDTYDGPLCRVCSECTVERLKQGFAPPLPNHLTGSDRDCRLCIFIDSEWPRTTHLLAQACSTPPPGIRLFLTNEKAHMLCSQDADEKNITSQMKAREVYEVALRAEYDQNVDQLHPSQISSSRRLASSPVGIFKTESNIESANRRPILAADSEFNFVRIKGWLDTCIAEHQQCRKTIQGTKINDNTSKSPLPRRVIRIGSSEHKSPCLHISNGERGRYAALSYCWGKAADNPLITTRSNIEDLQKSIPMGLLPKTIQDAIAVSRRLGIEYLWVDSICIIQDDSDDFSTESVKMGMIFRQALFTIAATAASNSSEGLFKKRIIDLEILKQPRCVQLPRESSDLDSGDIFLKAQQYSDHYSLQSFDVELSNCQWNKRGWVVQERLLSRRILHYASEQLFWECQEGVYGESSKGALPESFLIHSKRSIFNRMARETTFAAQVASANHHLQTFRAVTYLAKDIVSNTLGITKWSTEEARHRFWERVVQTYNICDLTYETDKLPAILGLAQEIESFTRQTYYGGIWLEDIARGLYWHGSDGDKQLERLRSSGAPTWSWAAWKGPLQMATYVAEYDLGRPKVTEDMYQHIQSDNSRVFRILKIHAHFWQAEILDPLFQQEQSPRNQQWIVEDWWTPPGFTEDLFLNFPNWNCCEIRGDLSDTRSSGVYGLVAFDHPDFICYVNRKLVCVVLNTVRIKRLHSNEPGFGYYQLVVRELPEVPGVYQRLGIGISLSVGSDRIAHGWLGRRSPSTKINLI